MKITETNDIFFCHARSGFKIALSSYNFSPETEILVPDFNCESMFHCERDLKIKFITFKMNLDLTINWIDLKKKLNIKSKVLLFVNYFGVPNEIEKLLEFSKKNNLILIEDNSHGYKGKFNNIELGRFGDIGISSPRKHIPLKNGGVLYSKKKIDFIMNKLPTNKILIRDKLNFQISYNLPNVKSILRKIITKPINFRNSISSEDYFEDFLLDEYSKKLITSKIDWDKIVSLKFENFKKWEHFAKKNSLFPLFNSYTNDINPWCFPVLIPNNSEINKWLNWGWKNKKIIFTWPSMSKNISKSSDAYKLSNSLLCFSTYSNPNYNDF